MRDRGKAFEEKFRKDWFIAFPDSVLFRIPDQMSRYKNTSKNICDFIGYNEGILYLIECKTHKKASIPFECIKQYPLLKNYIGAKGVRTGVVLWLYDKDVVYYIPTATIKKLKEDGKKSVGIKAFEEGYNIKIIPSVKKRVFLDSDYSLLNSLQEGE